MQSIGVDIGKRNSQVSVRNEDGEEVLNLRLPTTARSLTDWFGAQPRSRILIESCTAARWVKKVLESLSHEVVVADPNFLPMYVDAKNKRKKTDKRDASLLSQALIKDNWRPAHMRSEREQTRKTQIDVRARLVASRTKHINGVRALFSQWGLEQSRCAPENFVEKTVELAKSLGSELRQLAELELKAVKMLNAAIARLDKKIEKEARSNRDIALLASVPCVGPITATTFVATIDDPTRFDDGHQLASYLGLAPSEMSSGERRVIGHITKAGPKYLRSLLVQVAQTILRSKMSEARKLRTWGESLSTRRGKRIAIVALARKLAGVMLAIWKKKTSFDPLHGETGQQLLQGSDGCAA